MDSCPYVCIKQFEFLEGKFIVLELLTKYWNFLYKSLELYTRLH